MHYIHALRYSSCFISSSIFGSVHLIANDIANELIRIISHCTSYAHTKFKPMQFVHTTLNLNSPGYKFKFNIISFPSQLIQPQPQPQPPRQFPPVFHAPQPVCRSVSYPPFNP